MNITQDFGKKDSTIGQDAVSPFLNQHHEETPKEVLEQSSNEGKQNGDDTAGVKIRPDSNGSSPKSRTIDHANAQDQP